MLFSCSIQQSKYQSFLDTFCCLIAQWYHCNLKEQALLEHAQHDRWVIHFRIKASPVFNTKFDQFSHIRYSSLQHSLNDGFQIKNPDKNSFRNEKISRNSKKRKLHKITHNASHQTIQKCSFSWVFDVVCTFIAMGSKTLERHQMPLCVVLFEIFLTIWSSVPGQSCFEEELRLSFYSSWTSPFFSHFQKKIVFKVEFYPRFLSHKNATKITKMLHSFCYQSKLDSFKSI